MTKIYFYGGAFNPLTIAHQKIIDSLVNELKLNNCTDNNDILHIGVTSHDYKNYMFDKDIRLQFVKAYMDSKYLDKFGWEVSLQDDRTWKYLHKIYTDEAQKNITLVMGEDEYNDLIAEKWNYSKEILNTYNIKVIPRTDNVSSTKVRELIDNKQVDEIQNYISEDTKNILKQKGFLK